MSAIVNKRPDNFEELARFRQGMYRVFAAAFLPPRPERFVDLIAGCKPLESMELGIMSVLCAREAVARAEGSDRRLELALSSQVTFLDRYLDTWPPQFVEQITSMNSIPFYTALGPVVASFVHHDTGIARFLVRELSGSEPAR